MKYLTKRVLFALVKIIQFRETKESSVLFSSETIVLRCVNLLYDVKFF